MLNVGVGSAKMFAFLFPLDSGQWLGFFRVGLALALLGYGWSIRADWLSIIGGQNLGLVDRQMSEVWSAADSVLIPRMSWLVATGGAVGLTEVQVLRVLWGALLAAGLFLVVGASSRAAAILAWFLHLAAAKSGGLFAYGVDNFLTMGLFYLAISPLPDRWSLDYKWFGWRSGAADFLGFHRRLLQMTLCLVYFFGGFSKCIGPGWWNGESLWRAVTQPPFATLPVDWIFHGKILLPVAGAFVCLLEVGYAFMIWTRARPVWLAAIIGMHLLIACTMGMWLFAFVLIVLNLAAFAPFESTFSHEVSSTRFVTMRKGQAARDNNIDRPTVIRHNPG